MLYQIINGRVMFAADTILEHINFEVKNKKDKIAVVGRNGAGKTTLLKIITGEVELTRIDGEDSAIVKPGNPTIGYLKQITFDDLSVTLDEEIRKVFVRVIDMKEELDSLVKQMNEENNPELQEKLALKYTTMNEEFIDLGGFYYEKEYDIMLKSFGFEDSDKKKLLSEFSGGQLTKLAFIKLLLSKPDILLLDEPTNHLDMSTIAWLEQYLKDYSRAVVIVSHDRMFLDRVANTVYEVVYGEVVRYPGNYSDFCRIKKERYEKQLKDHIAQQKEIKRLMELVERFKNKPSKVAMTRSKLKQIEHMELVSKPADYDTKSFKAQYTPKLVTGNDVLLVKDLEIGYDSVLSRVSLDIKKGTRLGIIGDNGIGKSTLLKTLVGELEPISGDFKYGVNVQIGYFDQRMAQYTSDKTVLDDFWDAYPNMTMTEVRNALGAFLFTQDDVYKDVAMLSGGEKVRLALSKIFQEKPNVLILDEPTNHMDMVGKESLEAMLSNFEGTVIFVSHDRYFVKKVATTLLVMDSEGSKLFPFGFDDYEEKYSKPIDTGRSAGNAKSSDSAKPAAGSVAATSSNNCDEKQEKKTGNAQESYMASKEAARAERKIKKLEDNMSVLEEKIEKLKVELTNPDHASDYMKLQEIQDAIAAGEEELLEIMEEWEALQ